MRSGRDSGGAIWAARFGRRDLGGARAPVAFFE